MKPLTPAMPTKERALVSAPEDDFLSAPPEGMSESHPWRRSEDPAIYASAREHMRNRPIRGDMDLYEYNRRMMDVLLERHVPAADRRPFIRIVDDLCNIVSVADQMIDEEQRNSTCHSEELHSIIAAMKADRDKDSSRSSTLIQELQLSESARKELVRKVEVLGADLENTQAELQATRRAAADHRRRSETLSRKNEELRVKASEEARRLSESQDLNGELSKQLEELSKQLQRIKDKRSGDAKHADNMLDRVREAERDNVIYMKRIMKLGDEHKEKIKNAKMAHCSEVERMKHQYDKMHKAFGKERERLWEEILKLQPPESNEKDLMQVGPRSFRRRDFLARRLITTRSKYYFESDEEA